VEIIRRHEVQALQNSGVTSLQLLFPGNSRSQRVTITRVTVAPGATNTRHRHHSSEQAWAALAGEGRLLLSDDREMPFAAGDVVRFEEGELHGLVNRGNIDFEYLSVTSPPIDFRMAYGATWRRTNRSMPAANVIPVLHYPDVGAAVDWLCRAFGAVERLRIGDHRAQLILEGGAVVVAHSSDARQPTSDSIMVRVADVDSHCARAAQHAARILAPPADFPYGERQYTAEDPGGHRWTFSQTTADVDPGAFGAVLFDRA
jgi:uncharacterized glyoxalase superfamily protein PhnB/quercetin dioxygenase-like cupin family protein